MIRPHQPSSLPGCVGLALAAGVLALSAPASANSGDNLKFSARHEVAHDSNLFRVAPGQRPSGGKSDTLNTTTLGVQYDKMYSLQRIELDASLVHRRYRNFDYLNFSTVDYRGAWHWAATPHLRGILSTERRTRPNSYADVANIAARNLRTENTFAFTGELDLAETLQFLGGVGQRRLSNEQIVLQDRDSRIRTVAAGLRYRYPSGSYLGYGYKLSRGVYLHGPSGPSVTTPVDFDQSEHEFTARLAYSAKTSMRGSLSYLRRSHPQAPQRDFGLPLAEVRLHWEPTGKISVDAGVERGFIVSHNEYASYAVGSRFSLRPTWNATAKTSVRLQLEYLDQQYKGALNQGALFRGRDDATRLARIALDWRPRDALLLTLQLQTEHRSSNFGNFDYNTHGASLAARLQF